MRDSEFIPVICLTIFAGIISGFTSCAFERTRIREDAKSHGVAEYYLDENDARQFRWVTPEKEGEQEE